MNTSTITNDDALPMGLNFDDFLISDVNPLQESANVVSEMARWILNGVRQGTVNVVTNVGTVVYAGVQVGAYEAYKGIGLSSLPQGDVQELILKTGSEQFEHFLRSLSSYLVSLSKEKLSTIKDTGCDALLHTLAKDSTLDQKLPEILLRAGKNLVVQTLAENKTQRVDLVDVLLFVLKNIQKDLEEIHKAPLEKKAEKRAALSEKVIKLAFPNGAKDLPISDGGLLFKYLAPVLIPIFIESLYEVINDPFGKDVSNELKALPKGGNTLWLIAKRVGELASKEHGPSLVVGFKNEISDLVLELFEDTNDTNKIKEYLASQVEKLALTKCDETTNVFSFGSELVTKLVTHAIYSLVKGTQEDAVPLFFSKLKTAFLEPLDTDLFTEKEGKLVFDAILADIPLDKDHLLELAPTIRKTLVPQLISEYVKDVKDPLKKGYDFLPLAKPLVGYLKKMLQEKDSELAKSLFKLFSEEFTDKDLPSLVLSLTLDDPKVEALLEKCVASLIFRFVNGLKSKKKSIPIALEELVDAFLSNGRVGLSVKINDLFREANMRPWVIPLPNKNLKELAFNALRDNVLPDVLATFFEARAPLVKQLCLRLNWTKEKTFKASLGDQGHFLFTQFKDLIDKYKSPELLSRCTGISIDDAKSLLNDTFYQKILNKNIETFFFYSLSHMVGSNDPKPLLPSLFEKIIGPFNTSSDGNAIYSAFTSWMNLGDLLDVKELSQSNKEWQLWFGQAFVAFSGNDDEYSFLKKSLVELLEDKAAVVQLPNNSEGVTVADLEKAQENYLLKREGIVESIESLLDKQAQKMVAGPLCSWLESYKGAPEAESFLSQLSPKSEEPHQKAFFSWMTKEIKKTLFIGLVGLIETVKEERSFNMDTLPSQVIDWMLLRWKDHQDKVSLEDVYKMVTVSDSKELAKLRTHARLTLTPFCKDLVEVSFKNHFQALPFPEELSVWMFKQLEEEWLPDLLIDHIQSLHGQLQDKENLQVELRSLFGTNYVNEFARVLGIYAKQAFQVYLKGESKVFLEGFPEEFSINIEEPLEGFSLAWDYVENKIETALLQMVHGFSKEIAEREQENGDPSLFFKEFVKECLTSAVTYFKAFNEIVVTEKRQSASQVSLEIFAKELEKKGVTHKGKDAADSLESLLRGYFNNAKIEYFHLPKHTYLEKSPHFCAYFEETPFTTEDKVKQWKLKDKKTIDVVCKEAAGLALTEEFFKPLTERLLKLSGLDDLSLFPAQKEVGEKTYLFLKEAVIPGLLKSVFDSLMDPQTLHSLMAQSLDLIKDVECVAEKEQIKENFKSLKSIIDLMNEAIRKESDNQAERVARQQSSLKECFSKFKEVNHALPSTVVFMHIEQIDLRTRNFLQAFKEPLKQEELDSARAALEKSLSDAKEKLYPEQTTDDTEAVREFNETCGKLVLEIISFIPSVLTQPLLKTENIKHFSHEAIGKAILEEINSRSWTLLKCIDKAAEKILPTVHEGKFEGDAHEVEFKPQRSKEFKFYSESLNLDEQAKSASKLHKKLVDDIAKTVYEQFSQTISRSFKYHWRRFQVMIDDYIDTKFGTNGIKIKQYLDNQFNLIFVRGVGALLSFFLYHLFLPIFWVIDLYNKRQVRGFIKNGEHEAHKHLILNLLDNFIQKLEA